MLPLSFHENETARRNLFAWLINNDAFWLVNQAIRLCRWCGLFEFIDDDCLVNSSQPQPIVEVGITSPEDLYVSPDNLVDESNRCTILERDKKPRGPNDQRLLEFVVKLKNHDYPARRRRHIRATAAALERIWSPVTSCGIAWPTVLV